MSDLYKLPPKAYKTSFLKLYQMKKQFLPTEATATVLPQSSSLQWRPSGREGSSIVFFKGTYYVYGGMNHSILNEIAALKIWTHEGIAFLDWQKLSQSKVNRERELLKG